MTVCTVTLGHDGLTIDAQQARFLISDALSAAGEILATFLDGVGTWEADDGTCRHCSRAITPENNRWIDPAATGDDSVWRETCDASPTFTAEHEPGTVIVTETSDAWIVNAPQGAYDDLRTLLSAYATAWGQDAIGCIIHDESWGPSYCEATA